MLVLEGFTRRRNILPTRAAVYAFQYAAIPTARQYIQGGRRRVCVNGYQLGPGIKPRHGGPRYSLVCTFTQNPIRDV
jgi:hypothetical protein